MRRMLAIAAMAMTVLVPGLAAAQAPPGGQSHGGPPHGAPARGPGPAAHGPVAAPQLRAHQGPVGPAHVGPVGPVHVAPVGPVHVGPVGGPVHVGPAGVGVHIGGPPGPGGQFMFRGHPFNRVHLAPFAYPSGYAYRRWEAGAVLPPLFLVPDYYYADWATLGLEPPPPGAQWVRYGPDLLLVDTTSGQVLDVAYGVFYD
jgi:Nickel/cobalt transporter regulator